MITGRIFLKISFLVYLVIIGLLVAAYLLSFINNSVFYSILSSSMIVGGSFITGILAIRFSLNKSHEIFIFTVFGGMFLRLIIMLGLVFICLRFLELNPNSFIFSILFFYVFFLLVEIIYLNFRKK
jgi:hypothetical protein